MCLVVQPVAHESSKTIEIAEYQPHHRHLARRQIQVAYCLVEERIGDSREPSQMVGRGGDRPTETAVGGLRVGIPHQSFEGVAGALECLVRQLGGAGLGTKGHCGTKQREAMFCKVSIDRRAERRGILGQNAITSHQRPCCPAIEQPALHSVLRRPR